jgi:DNA (cytosine-5)-methyltransferase 1
MRIGVIDLFCGIGGLSYGFKCEGFDVIAGIDSDASCKYAYEANVEAEFIAADVGLISGRQIARLFSKPKFAYRVLIGCAPCTPFSIYTGRYRKARRRDHRWQLLEEFGRLIGQTKPDVVSMENVPRLTRHPIFNRFVRDLEVAGYSVTYQKVRADHYGVPQRRARLVLFASLWGEVKFPAATHRDKPVTVRDAIGNLPQIQAGGPCRNDRLHVTRSLTPKNLERLRSTKEGGSWKDWDKTLQLRCHRRKQGKSFRSVYGRMTWDAPSPVITTQCLGIGNGRFGHPKQNRAISIREAALLQSFPKKFRLVAPGERVNGTQLSRQIGNAVPVKLSRVIARAIKRHLRSVSIDASEFAAG